MSNPQANNVKAKLPRPSQRLQGQAQVQRQIQQTSTTTFLQRFLGPNPMPPKTPSRGT